jgi:hypothetical protein
MPKDAHMKCWIVALGVLSTISSAHAIELGRLSAENFSLHFSSGQGAVSADSVSFYQNRWGLKLTTPTIDLARDEERFHASYEGLDTALDLSLSPMLASISQLNVSIGQLDLTPSERIEAQFERLSFEMGEGEQNFDGVRLSCRRTEQKNRSDDALTWVSPCFDLGLLKIPVLKVAEKSAATLTRALSATAEKGMNFNQVKDITLMQSGGRFTLSLEAKYIFNWTVKASGQSFVDEKNRKMVFVLEKAKAGIFSVKSKILKELGKADIKNITVDGDRISIGL